MRIITKLTELLYVLISIILCIKLTESKCHLQKDILNCSRSNLADCPPYKDKISKLILDYNKLTKFPTKNCTKWLKIDALSLRHNKIGTIRLSEMKISILDVSYNNLKFVNLNSSFLMYVILAHNNIGKVVMGNIKSILKLDFSYNSIPISNITSIYNALMRVKNIEELDFSYNSISAVPQGLSFDPSRLKLLNFAGNKFRKVNFVNFPRTRTSKTGYTLNLTRNVIDSVVIVKEHSISVLDLSYNKLSTVSVSSIKRLKLKQLDLLGNPILCNCTLHSEFINWVRANPKILIHQSLTMCKDTKKSIDKMNCLTTTTVSTTSVVSSTTKKSSTAYPIPTSVTPSKRDRNMSAGTIVGIVFATVIPLAVLIYLITKSSMFCPRSGYRQISNTEPNISTNSCLENIRLTLLSSSTSRGAAQNRNSKNRNDGTSNNNYGSIQQPQSTTARYLNQSINLRMAFIMFCSERANGSQIVNDLISRSTDIIHKFYRKLPNITSLSNIDSDAIIVFLYDKKCCTDINFLENIDMALQTKMSIKLVLRFMISVDDVKRNVRGNARSFLIDRLNQGNVYGYFLLESYDDGQIKELFNWLKNGSPNIYV